MDINWDLRNLKPNRKAIITVGTFDGIHIGHQALIQKVIEKANRCDGRSTLVTFSPHPKLVVGRKNAEAIKLLSTIDEKIAFLEQIGLDQLIIIKFTESFSKISSTDFIEKILIKRIGFQEIVIGHDHAFGKDRQGRYVLLKQLASKYQYRIELVDAVCVDGEIVSSTLLRNLLAAGSLEKANRFSSILLRSTDTLPLGASGFFIYSPLKQSLDFKMSLSTQFFKHFLIFFT